LLSILLTEVV